MFRRVLVGVDGRPGGRDAIALARQLAAPDAVTILALDSIALDVIAQLAQLPDRRVKHPACALGPVRGQRR